MFAGMLPLETGYCSALNAVTNRTNMLHLKEGGQRSPAHEQVHIIKIPSEWQMETWILPLEIDMLVSDSDRSSWWLSCQKRRDEATAVITCPRCDHISLTEEEREDNPVVSIVLCCQKLTTTDKTSRFAGGCVYEHRCIISRWVLIIVKMDCCRFGICTVLAKTLNAPPSTITISPGSTVPSTVILTSHEYF